MYLVTGGAGFIGSAVVRTLVRRDGANVVNVDKLTYAANLDSLVDVELDARYYFERADICDGVGDAPRVRALPARRRASPGGRIARRPIHRRPGRLRPDEHCRHVRAAHGSATVLEIAPAGERASVPVRARLDRRGLRVARRHGLLHGSIAIRSDVAVLGEQGSADHLARAWHRTYGLPVDRHELLEQLRAVSVSRKADSAHDPQRVGRSTDRRVRARRERARLALCRRSRGRAARRARARPGRRDVRDRRRHRATEHRRRRDDLRSAR